MKVSVVGKELEFREYLYSNEKTGEWFAEFPLSGSEVTFEFEEKIFKKFKNSIVKPVVDWSIISGVINNLMSDHIFLVKKSQPLLLALNMSLFNKNEIYPDGFFELTSLNLKRANEENYEISLYFEFLTSKGDPIDPYFFWIVSFSKKGLINGLNYMAVGVERREVNDPGF